MADIFQEIEDDLRHEQYRKLWQRYGSWVVGAAVLLVLATAAYVAWREISAGNRIEQSAAYNQALAAAQADPSAADASLANLADGSGAYAALARLERAGLSGAGGNHADAAQQYRALADDKSVDAILRDFARIQWGYHSLAADADRAAVVTEMQTIADGGGPWRHNAREVLAAVALTDGDTARAKELFGLIADDAEAPQSIRARASEALAALGN